MFRKTLMCSYALRCECGYINATVSVCMAAYEMTTKGILIFLITLPINQGQPNKSQLEQDAIIHIEK